MDGIERLVVIAAEQDYAMQVAAFADDAAHANDRIADRGAVQNTAIGNDRVIDLAAIDL